MKAWSQAAQRAAAVAVVLLVVAAGMAGCAASSSGSGAGSGAGAGGGATAGPTATSPSTLPGPVRPSTTESPSTFPEDDPTFLSGATVTLSGTVQLGAEPGCLILTTKAGQLELISPTPTPHEGDQVTVTGHVVKAMSHCMQGRPFRVQNLTIH
jgi:hypothetical protein